VLARNPFLRDSLLIGQDGERVISKVVPSYVYNTVDQPIFPTSGKRFTTSIDLAGLGGNTNFYKPVVEGVWFIKHGARLTLGMRGQLEYIHSFTNASKELPIFEKLFLGGEYSIRGFDIRSVGPRDLASGIVIGGNKSLLFNGEYLINIAGPVRLVLFADAGQVRDRGQSFGWKEPVTKLTTIGGLAPADSLTAIYAIGGFASQLQTRIDTTGETNAFKTSLGAEIRFFMPVLNVPFRLIFAANPSRGGVLDNNLRPEKLFKFRFAVGTTF
jgi:outer membrane protein assembly factor BamA